jgi:hypothetical protein
MSEDGKVVRPNGVTPYFTGVGPGAGGVGRAVLARPQLEKLTTVADAGSS